METVIAIKRFKAIQIILTKTLNWVRNRSWWKQDWALPEKKSKGGGGGEDADFVGVFKKEHQKIPVVN